MPKAMQIARGLGLAPRAIVYTLISEQASLAIHETPASPHSGTAGPGISNDRQPTVQSRDPLASRMQIEHWHPSDDGPLSEAALRRKIERRGYRVKRYVYSAGVFFPAHEHAEDKIDAVVSGRFRVTMQSQEAILEAGDLVLIPKHVEHTAEVVGDEPVVSLDGIRCD